MLKVILCQVALRPRRISTEIVEMRTAVAVAQLSLLVVSGCASHTGVVAMGKDTYFIAKQQATGYPGLGNMKAEIIGEGANYCAAKGKEFQIVSSHETQPPYVLGNYPRSEIQFMCLAADDPEYQRPKSVQAPDNVTETRSR